MYFVLLCFVFAAGGCSLGPVKTKLTDMPRIAKIDPDSGAIISANQRTGQAASARKSAISGPSCFKMNYERLPFLVSSLPAVKGKFPNGKTYDIFIDTGFSEYIWMNELVVKENDLPIYPLGSSQFSEAQAGVCYLPWVNIGPAKIVNPPARYQQLHWEFKLLGLPLWQQRTVLLGLKSVLKFDYVVFDNRAGQVNFCSDGEFTPTAGKWKSFKYTIEPDNANNIRLMVNMPLAGQTRKVMFDTCGGYGLVIHPAAWRGISAELGRPKFSNGTFISGFQGFLPCKKGRVDELRIGDRLIKDAHIVVPDESTSYLGTVEAVLGMAYFKDSVIVIDNVNQQFWIGS